MKYDGSKQILDGFLKIKQEYPFNYPVKKSDPFYKLVCKCLKSCDLFGYVKYCKENGLHYPKIEIFKNDIDKVFITKVLQTYLDDWLEDYDNLQEYINDADPNIISIRQMIATCATDIFEICDKSINNIFENEDNYLLYDQYIIAIWSVLPEVYNKVTGGNIEVFG